MGAKRKVILIVVVGLVVIGAGVGGAILFKTNREKAFLRSHTSNTRPTKKADSAYTPPEVVKSFDSLETQYSQGKYAEFIPAAEVYARDESHDSSSRLSMYEMCIRAALKTKVQAEADVCKQEALTLAAARTDQAGRDGWKNLITDAYNGVNPKDSTVSQ
ncbi:MAG: hypothetical protein JWO47_843 [Candidatus Saccharibacteria bacterium]|nr:hypothetical protein [Candidatus Saccharibacteria bacterium]